MLLAQHCLQQPVTAVEVVILQLCNADFHVPETFARERRPGHVTQDRHLIHPEATPHLLRKAETM